VLDIYDRLSSIIIVIFVIAYFADGKVYLNKPTLCLNRPGPSSLYTPHDTSRTTGIDGVFACKCFNPLSILCSETVNNSCCNAGGGPA
jgi:hypothetical protein